MREEIAIVELDAPVSAPMAIYAEKIMELAGCRFASGCRGLIVAVVRRGDRLLLIYPTRDIRDAFFAEVREEYPDAVFLRVEWADSKSAVLVYVA